MEWNVARCVWAAASFLQNRLDGGLAREWRHAPGLGESCGIGAKSTPARNEKNTPREHLNREKIREQGARRMWRTASWHCTDDITPRRPQRDRKARAAESSPISNPLSLTRQHHTSHLRI